MKDIKGLLITKASGKTVPFSAEKLARSLTRAGAPVAVADQIVEQLEPRLYEGISTRKIYRMAFDLLRKNAQPLAAKYHLKKGIMELGPSGFPFERFVAEILRCQGYDAVVGTIVKGKCVDHEIDVIATKAAQHCMIECKFHNRTGTVCDVKVPLYIHARFRDVENEWLKTSAYSGMAHQGWVVTNTRFTDDAIRYGTCAGLQLVGWDYPNGGSLRSQIDSLGLYPVTCLTTLSKSEKAVLLAKGLVLAHDLCSNEKILLEAGIKLSRIKSIQEECTLLCKKNNKEQVTEK